MLKKALVEYLYISIKVVHLLSRNLTGPNSQICVWGGGGGDLNNHFVLFGTIIFLITNKDLGHKRFGTATATKFGAKLVPIKEESRFRQKFFLSFSCIGLYLQI